MHKGYGYLDFDHNSLNPESEYFVRVKLDDDGLVIEICNKDTGLPTEFTTWALYAELNNEEIRVRH